MNIYDVKYNIDLDKKRWRHIFSTNCYAYALGLDIKERNIMIDAYQPGVISGDYESICKSDYFSYMSLLECFFNDMKELGIGIKEIKPFDKISSDEWKVALFTSFYEYNGYTEVLSDYHFLRQMEDGYWYHKPGYMHRPTNKDSMGKLITNPNECFICGKEYKKTYALKKN